MVGGVGGSMEQDIKILVRAVFESINESQFTKSIASVIQELDRLQKAQTKFGAAKKTVIDAFEAANKAVPEKVSNARNYKQAQVALANYGAEQLVAIQRNDQLVQANKIVTKSEIAKAKAQEAIAKPVLTLEDITKRFTPPPEPSKEELKAEKEKQAMVKRNVGLQRSLHRQASRFRFEYLGIMFAGQALKRQMQGSVAAATETQKAFKKNNEEMGKLVDKSAIMKAYVSFISGTKNIPLVGELVSGLYIIGDVVSQFGQIALLLSSLNSARLQGAQTELMILHAKVAGLDVDKYAYIVQRSTLKNMFLRFSGINAISKLLGHQLVIEKAITNEVAKQAVVQTVSTAAGAGRGLRGNTRGGAMMMPNMGGGKAAGLTMFAGMAATLVGITGAAGEASDSLTMLGTILTVLSMVMMMFQMSTGTTTATMGAMSAITGPLAAGFGILTGAIGATTGAVWAFTVALLANPLTWIILAIIAVVAAIIAFKDQIAGFFGGILDGIKDVLGGIWDFVNGLGQGIADFLGGLGKGASDLWESMKKGAYGTVKAIGDWFSWLAKQLGNFWNNLTGQGGGAGGGGGGQTPTQKAADIIKTLINRFAVLGKMSSTIKGLQMMQTILRSLGQTGAANAIQKQIDIIQQAMSVYASDTIPLMDELAQAFGMPNALTALAVFKDQFTAMLSTIIGPEEAKIFEDAMTSVFKTAASGVQITLPDSVIQGIIGKFEQMNVDLSGVLGRTELMAGVSFARSAIEAGVGIDKIKGYLANLGYKTEEIGTIMTTAMGTTATTMSESYDTCMKEILADIDTIEAKNNGLLITLKANAKHTADEVYIAYKTALQKMASGIEMMAKIFEALGMKGLSNLLKGFANVIANMPIGVNYNPSGPNQGGVGDLQEYALGGIVNRTGTALIHAGEMVLPPDITKTLLDFAGKGVTRNSAMSTPLYNSRNESNGPMVPQQVSISLNDVNIASSYDVHSMMDEIETRLRARSLAY